MTSIKGLTEAQFAALAGVAVGDLVFVEKLDLTRYDESESEDGEDDGDEDGEDEEASDQDDQDEDDADSNDNDEDDETSNDEPDDESSDDSGAEQSDDTDASSTFTPIPPRMYAVSGITKNVLGNITDIKLSLLTYSSNAKQQDSTHAYHVYGKECVHHHPASCGQDQPCSTAVSVTEIATEDGIRFMARPHGDYVRRLDSSIHGGDQGRSMCVDGCNQGWLDNTSRLQDMVKDYDPPTLTWALATGEEIPSNLQPTVCPVCVGVDHMKDQQSLQGSLLQAGFVDFTEMYEYNHRLNPRRRELGYRYRQYNEREWGMHFDDMLSEDEDEGEGEQYEQWQEAQDPNSGAQTRPASDETIASLPRKTYKDAELDIEICQICTEKFKEDSELIELSCGHACFDAACLEQWLKQYDTCPICRKTVPAVKATEAQAVPTAQATESQTVPAADNDGDTDEFHDAVAEMDGEDVVMSDE